VRKIIIGLLAVGVVGFGLGAGRVRAADEAAPAATPAPAAPAAAAPAAPAAGGAPPAAAEAAGGAAQPGGPMLGPATPPLDLVASTPKGQLKNPYNGDIAAIAEEGHHRFLSAGCNGCHGGGGGGGMCPPLTNDTWVYGAADDTLFRLIALGSDGLQKAGYTRLKHEVVVGPMPPFGSIIKTSDDLWRIIAFIRSVNPSSMKLVDVPYAPNPY
jgi:mono/diheme cytochrome c family protein